VTTLTAIRNTRKTIMVERLVIDASVAIAFLRDERYSLPVQAAVQSWSSARAELLVPTHFWLEVTNSLIRRHGYAPSQVLADFVTLDGLELQTIDLDRPLLLLAMDPMVDFGLSAYDGIYLALARAMGAKLATLDGRLAAAAGDLGLLLSDDQQSRLSENVTVYRSAAVDDPGWAHSAVVGAEIARLRREFAAREIPFAALGRSGHRTTARDVEETLAADWSDAAER
jgi:predicted nucleic acid-binding protein